ncbi:hypothetical protein LJC51_07625 [Lachnospiraceae bacterium OttesenSCG-928-J05]|nr:hypothetical protein [Lachnospiraceae bacterium OttesenSCG-928-J05]
MLSLSKTIFKIKSAYLVNGVFYFLKRVPLLKRAISDNVYADSTTKTALSAIFVAIKTLLSFVFSIFYVLLVAVLPVELFSEDIRQGMGSEGALGMGVYVLLILSGVMMLFMESTILNSSKEKYIAIRFMRVRPKDYMKATFLFGKLKLAVGFYLGISVMVFIFSGISLRSLGRAFVILLVLMSFRFLGEAFQLMTSKKLKRSLFRNTKLVMIVMLIALIVAYGLPLFYVYQKGEFWQFSTLLLRGVCSPVGVILSLLVIAFSLYYIYQRFSSWQRVTMMNLKQEYIQVDGKKTAAATFKEVEMKESDLTVNQRRMAVINKKKGYAYFQALFFARHNRLLFHPVLIRLAIIWVCVALSAITILFVPEFKKPFLALPNYLPVLVFIMYVINTGQKSTKAMFYNCDNSMLKFNFYRKPGVILKNFNIRLRYVMLYNFPISVSICLGVMVLTALSGGEIFTRDLLLLYICVLMLSVLFCVHNLFLYYVLQPYTTDLAIKNPLYRLISQGMYILCFVSYQIRRGGFAFTLIVLGVTVVYSVVALVLVYKFSPKYFRVK